MKNIDDVKARRRALSSDGRRWAKDSSTRWHEYGELRFANCRGSHICKNEACPYKTQYGVVNKLQFTKGNKCTACGVTAEFVVCRARRYTHMSGTNLKVFHCGVHTCPVRAKQPDKPVGNVRDLLRKDPTLKPSEVQSALLVSSLRGKESWDKIDKQASQLVDREWIANQKRTVRRDINPVGENYEGLVTFKHHCDKKDQFYIYKINDSRGNPDSPSFVFKTSKVKMFMANNMNKDGDHFLSKEFCFFDGKEKRCKNYTILTASVYHPLLKKQIPLAIMETEAEDSRCVTLFWTLFQEALQKATSDKDNIFNPTGWSTDMAGANLVGLKVVFGNEALERVKTCEFHFKQNRNKKARQLDDESSQEFKENCEALLVAQTVNGYTAAMNDLKKFAKDKPDRQYLESWLKWWDDRREFIFNAFTPADGPKMNQAEVIHASWAHRDRSNLSLLEVAHMDTRDSVLLEAQLNAYKNGTSSGGTGPSFAQRNYRRELDQAARFGREIIELGIGNTVDGTSRHRPPEQGKTKKSKGKRVSASTSSQGAPEKNSSASTSSQSAPRRTLASTSSQSVSQPILTSTSSQSTATTYMSCIDSSSSQPSTFAFTQHVPPLLPYSPFRFSSTDTGFPRRMTNVNNNVSPTTLFPQPFTTPNHLTHLPCTSTSPTPIWHSGMSPYQYELIVLPTNVRKCYGCGNDFVDKYRHHPFNIVVKHVDRRVMRKDIITGSLIYSPDFNNTYYHPCLDHIRRKNPLFTGLVCLSSNLWGLLSDLQKQVLKNTDLNIQISRIT